jgi:hypothetical protein
LTGVGWHKTRDIARGPKKREELVEADAMGNGRKDEGRKKVYLEMEAQASERRSEGVTRPRKDWRGEEKPRRQEVMRRVGVPVTR